VCGIVGKIDYQGRANEALLHRMCAAMEHRGPDSRGTFVDGGVSLGVQRLAIIDLAGGDQPIFNEDRSVAVVMNGEIYNFQELRSELTKKKHRFTSEGDTEVLVHLYEEHGHRMVDRLRGMFAFAIWDERQRQLFLGRDRAGKKPLFWARKGSRFWFASEVRSLLADPEIERDVDPTAIATYLTLQYVPHPLSAFKGINKLEPATTMVVTAQGERLERYWSLDYSQQVSAASVREVEERLRSQIWEATRIRLMSEVPLGAFLSGGVDSSAVVAAMADQMAEPVKTFSIGFAEGDYDELPYARLVAERFGTNHHEFVVETDAVSIMPKLARHYGEPFADPSAIPSFYLAELTKRHVTVALNGDGGDEGFAGYLRYVGNDLAGRLARLPRPIRALGPWIGNFVPEGSRSNSTRARVRRLGRTLAMTPGLRYARWLSSFDADARRQLFTDDFAAQIGDWQPETVLLDAWDRSTAIRPVERMMDTDIHTYLPADLLVKMDIATMAYSLEARSPFLDHQLMELAASLPADLKLNGSRGKLILKAALRGILPDEILDRPKMGFGVPLDRWFREELRELPSEILLDADSLDRGYFRRSAVERLIREHREGTADNATRIWVLLQLEMWHREVVGAPPAPLDDLAKRAG
jgi:asparagine synthase (glutamine-hydrolysing)